MWFNDPARRAVDLQLSRELYNWPGQGSTVFGGVVRRCFRPFETLHGSRGPSSAGIKFWLFVKDANAGQNQMLERGDFMHHWFLRSNYITISVTAFVSHRKNLTEIVCTLTWYTICSLTPVMSLAGNFPKFLAFRRCSWGIGIKASFLWISADSVISAEFGYFFLWSATLREFQAFSQLNAYF